MGALLATRRLGQATASDTPGLGLAGAAVLALAAAWLGWRAGVAPSRLAALLLLAPLAEEIIFRGGLQHALSAWGIPAGWAIGLATLAFALAHAALHGELHGLLVVVPSWCLGMVYERRGRLREVVMLHAAMNASWLTAAAGLGMLTGPLAASARPI